MIGPGTDHEGNALPEGSTFTAVLAQKHLDECSRALGRPLWNFEVKILDRLMEIQAKVNNKLAKQGKLSRTHSMDELVALFIVRVQSAEARKLTDKLMSDVGGAESRAKIYKQLGDIANRT